MKKSDSIIISAVTAASAAVGVVSTYFLLKNKEKIAENCKLRETYTVAHNFFENVFSSAKKRAEAQEESLDFVEDETENVSVDCAAEETNCEEKNMISEEAPEAISEEVPEEKNDKKPAKSTGKGRKKTRVQPEISEAIPEITEE